MKKIILATAVGLGTLDSAFAVTAQSGVYVGGNLGWSFPQTYTDSSVGTLTGSTATQSNKGFSGGAVLGYDYAINQSFLVGAELGYNYLGKTEYDLNDQGATASISDHDTAFQILATSTYLNQNGFNAFVKAGMARLDTSVSTSIPALTDAINSQGYGSVAKWLPAAAIGVGYMPMQNLNVALQYERIFGNNSDNAITDTSNKPKTQNTVSLGVTYKFAL